LASTFLIKSLNSRLNKCASDFKTPVCIYLDKLDFYCEKKPILKAISELTQMLYSFRHLQNSIFDNLKYYDCYVDLPKFKNELKSIEINDLTDNSHSILSLSSRLIEGKTPLCIYNISQIVNPNDANSDLIFNKLKVYGRNLVYRLLCTEKTENHLIFAILRNLGLHINNELRNIAFRTIRKDVRECLLVHLEHSKRLKENEKKEIDFLRYLEKLLPNQSYSVAKQRCWFKMLRFKGKEGGEKRKSDLHKSYYVLSAMKSISKAFLK
jgi:hypothetical protein